MGAGAVQANPWPRGEGNSFIALSVLNEDLSIWADHGLSSDRTLALSAYFGRNRDQRVGLRLTQSFENTLGQPRLGLFTFAEWRTDEMQTSHALGLGASVGRGLTSPFPGWASAEAQITMLRGTLYTRGIGHFEIKANATLGFRPAERLTIFTQLQAEHADGQTSAYLAPSVLWGIHPNASVEAGLRRQFLGGTKQQLKMGTWLRF